MAPRICNCAHAQSKDLLQDKIDELQYVLQKVKLCLKSKENLVEMQAGQLKKMEQMHKNVLDENEKLNYQNRRLSNDYENMKIILKGHESRRKRCEMLNGDAQTIWDLTDNGTQTDIKTTTEFEKDCSNCMTLTRKIEILEEEKNLVEIQAEQLKRMKQIHNILLDENEKLNYQNRSLLTDYENMKIILNGYESQLKRNEMQNCEAQTIWDITENGTQTDIRSSTELEKDCKMCKMLARKLEIMEEKKNLVDMQTQQLKIMEKMHKNVLDENEKLNYQIKDLSVDYENMKKMTKEHENLPKRNDMQNGDAQTMWDVTENGTQTDINKFTKLEKDCINCKKLERKLEILEEEKANLLTQIESYRKKTIISNDSQSMTDESYETIQSDQSLKDELENFKRQIEVLEQENNRLIMRNEEFMNIQVLEVPSNNNEESLNEIKQMFADLGNKLNKPIEERGYAGFDISTMKRMRQELMKHLDELQMELLEKTVKINDLEICLKHWEDKEIKNSDEMEKLENQVKRLEQDKWHNAASEIAFSEEVKKLKDHLDCFQKELREKSEKIEMIEQEKQDLQTQVGNLLQTMASDAATRMEKHESKHSLQSKPSELNYEKDLEGYKNQIDLLEQENELLKVCNKKLKEAQSSETETKAQDCRCEKTICELKTMIAELNNKLTGIDHEQLQDKKTGSVSEEVKNNMNKPQQKMPNKNENNKTFKDAMTNYDSELVKSNGNGKELKKLKESLRRLQKELLEANASEIASGKEVRELKILISALQKELTEKNRKIQSLEKEKDNKRLIKLKEQEIVRLKEDIIRYQKKIKQMEGSILANDSSNIDPNHELQLRQTNEKLRAKVESLEKFIADYEHEIECLREESCQSRVNLEQLKQLQNDRLALKSNMKRAEEDLKECHQELQLCKCHSSRLAREFVLLKKERLKEGKSIDENLVQDIIVKACRLKCCCFKLLNKYQVESTKIQELHQFHDILLDSYKKLEDQNRYYRTENTALRTAINNFACNCNYSMNAQVGKLIREFNEMRQAVGVPKRQEKETSVEVENHAIPIDRTLETDIKNNQTTPDKTIMISEWKNTNFTDSSKSFTGETSEQLEGVCNNELKNTCKESTDELCYQEKYSFSMDILEQILDTLEKRELDIKALTKQVETYKAKEGQVGQFKQHEIPLFTCQFKPQTTVGIQNNYINDNSEENEPEKNGCNKNCGAENKVVLDEKLQDEISKLENIIQKYQNEVNLITKHRDGLLNLQNKYENVNDGGKTGYSALLVDIFQESNIIKKLKHELAICEDELTKKSQERNQLLTLDSQIKEEINPKTQVTHLLKIIEEKENEVEKLKDKLLTCECFQEKYISDKNNVLQILLLQLKGCQGRSESIKKQSVSLNTCDENVCLVKQFYDCQEELEIANKLTAELNDLKNKVDLQSIERTKPTRDDYWLLLDRVYEREEEISHMKRKLVIWKHHYQRVILANKVVMESVENEIIKYKNHLQILTTEYNSLLVLEKQCKSGDIPFKGFDRVKLEENIVSRSKEITRIASILESYQLYLETSKQQRYSIEALYKDCSCLYSKDFTKLEIELEPFVNYRSGNGIVEEYNLNETVHNDQPRQECKNNQINSNDNFASYCTTQADTVSGSPNYNKDLLQDISNTDNNNKPFNEHSCNCNLGTECEDLKNAIKNHVEKISELFNKATGQKFSDFNNKESTCSTLCALDQLENCFSHLLSMIQQSDGASLQHSSPEVVCKAMKEKIELLHRDVEVKDNELEKYKEAQKNISLELAEVKNALINLFKVITELTEQIRGQKAVDFDLNDDICLNLHKAEQELGYCVECVQLERKQMDEALLSLDEQHELADKIEKLLHELDVKNNDIEELRTQIEIASQEANHFLELESASVKHIKSLLKLVNEFAGTETEKFNTAKGIVPLFENTEKLLKECFNNMQAEKFVETERYEQKIRLLEDGPRCNCYDLEKSSILGENIVTSQTNQIESALNDAGITNEKVEDNILNRLLNLENVSRNHIKKLAELVLTIKDTEIIDTEGNIESLFLTTEKILAECINEILNRKKSATTQEETVTENTLETPVHEVLLEDKDKDLLEQISRLQKCMVKLEIKILEIKNEYTNTTVYDNEQAIENVKVQYEQLIYEAKKQWQQRFEQLKCDIDVRNITKLVDKTVQCQLEPEQLKDEEEWTEKLKNKDCEINLLKEEVDQCNEIICAQSILEYFAEKYTDEEGLQKFKENELKHTNKILQVNVSNNPKLDNNKQGCSFIDKSKELEALKEGLREFYESGWKQLEKCKLDKIETEKCKNCEIEYLKKDNRELKEKINENRISVLQFVIDCMNDIIQCKLTKEEFEGTFNKCLVKCSEKERFYLRGELLNLCETFWNDREHFINQYSIGKDAELERFKQKLEEIEDLRKKEKEKWKQEMQECKLICRDYHNNKKSEIVALKSEIIKLQKEINNLNVESNLPLNLPCFETESTVHSLNCRCKQNPRESNDIIDKLREEIVAKDEELNSQKNELMALQSLKGDLEQAKDLWNSYKTVLQTKDEELENLKQDLKALKSNTLNRDETFRSIIEVTESLRNHCNFILHEYDCIVQDLREQQKINKILVNHYACLAQHFDSLKSELNHFKNNTREIIFNLQNKLGEVLSLLSVNKFPACVKNEIVDGTTTNEMLTNNLTSQEYIADLKDFISNIENQAEALIEQKTIETLMPSTATSSTRSNEIQAIEISSNESASGVNDMQIHIEALLNNLNQQNREYNDGIQKVESNAEKIKAKLKQLNEMTQKLKGKFNNSEQQ